MLLKMDLVEIRTVDLENLWLGLYVKLLRNSSQNGLCKHQFKQSYFGVCWLANLKSCWLKRVKTTKNNWSSSPRYLTCWPDIDYCQTDRLYCIVADQRSFMFENNHIIWDRFCLLLRVSLDYVQSITLQVTEVTCPVIGRSQSELTPSKRQKTDPDSTWQWKGHVFFYHSFTGLSIFTLKAIISSATACSSSSRIRFLLAE